jgi:hypothetical protein
LRFEHGQPFGAVISVHVVTCEFTSAGISGERLTDSYGVIEFGTRGVNGTRGVSRGGQAEAKTSRLSGVPQGLEGISMITKDITPFLGVKGFAIMNWALWRGLEDVLAVHFA